MREIQAAKNNKIKALKKLHQRKYRNQSEDYLLEGYHLIEEAAKAHAEIKEIFLDKRGLRLWQEWVENHQFTYYLLSDEAMKALSEQPAPQGIIALVQKSSNFPSDFSGKWLLLDNVQDPGNVGTIVRTADAAGFDGIFLGQGTADEYSPKVLRSMQGSQFHLPIFSGDLTEVIAEFQKIDSKIYGTKLDPAAISYNEVQKNEDFVLILGNEGQGVAEDLLQLTDQNLYIPIYGKAESLNVGVAAGILMYALI
ncbi:RNA methyltransferase [Tetragenococcus osmophilus]|uniref:RNA methyltransferase n=1 Tax=Tetragenococcus osmophilus TaxID=526944 RepID=A0AA37XJ59_9ENTE|nr:RNA methyltransferase [Tetragenococcus osmophilus]AYW48836.1 RNA methyltransferase [Tetragenococcus osmophilus]GMA71347.1 23S rRNA methyltransferase [Tetragenococcus osmophilus]